MLAEAVRVLVWAIRWIVEAVRGIVIVPVYGKWGWGAGGGLHVTQTTQGTIILPSDDQINRMKHFFSYSRSLGLHKKTPHRKIFELSL